MQVIITAVFLYAEKTTQFKSLIWLWDGTAPSGTEHSLGSSNSGGVRASSQSYGHQHSPVSPRTHENVQQRPSVLHNTGGKSLSVADHSSPSVFR